MQKIQLILTDRRETEISSRIIELESMTDMMDVGSEKVFYSPSSETILTIYEWISNFTDIKKYGIEEVSTENAGSYFKVKVLINGSSTFYFKIKTI